MEAEEMNPLALAFYGDAVYELYVREKLVRSGQGKPDCLHKSAVEKVCAVYQAGAARKIAGLLTPEEADIFRRGRNASGTKAPKNVDVSEYRCATGLEALIGWLGLKGRTDRINFLMEAILNPGEEIEKGSSETEDIGIV